MAVNRRKPLPLYYQLKNELLEDIKKGVYRENEKIPSENELQKLYNVSLITVRKALSDLVQEGILYRIQGKGTFVAKPKIQRFLSLQSFTEEMKQKGIELETKILKFLKEYADNEIGEALNLDSDKNVWVIERLRIGNGEPIAIQKSYLPCYLFKNFNLEYFKNSNSLYEIIKTKYDIVPYRAEEIYYSKNINDKNIAEQLSVGLKTAAFLVKRITFNQEGIPFEFTVSLLRGDIYSIRVNLKTEG
ncbi:GntR family transcriptional regulator [Thermovenabulum gondwanense]|uniref:HTH-type transcriptional repressor YvoA n=1 Tax=Thermovenabulum gondwanense TaxID=520767 RepID=A0A162MQD4_9FIRM|nr:GntR family transcriptional regulator [Thermovenabulum gondwanense]KYO66940.1 HTH-type transcriptional repressor YvoA [Thermovenabulum gondwanense]